MQTMFACVLQDSYKMAIYHCSIKTIGRSQGRSATGAAAYRSGTRIVDERTGDIHDYSRKRGVEYSEIVLPAGFPPIERSKLWNAAEAAEKRKNSTVAREYEIALPEELNPHQREVLAVEFAAYLAERYVVAADVAIHSPGRAGDHRNHHVHILTTTRQISHDGTLEAKTRSLDERRSGEVEHIRSVWARLANQALEKAGHATRLSHKSFEEQGINYAPGIHLGPAVTAMERRGMSTERGRLHRELIQERERQHSAGVKQAAAERIAAGLAEVQKKVEFLQAGMGRAAELERTAKEAELQSEKQRAEKVKKRGPGMGR